MEFQLQPIKREFELEGFHSLYYFELNKHFFHTQETHDFWEMVYVDNGSITAIVDGIGLSLKQGQAIFHKPDEPHAHISNQIEPSNIMVVSFSCNSPAMAFFDHKIFTLDKSPRKILSLFLQESERALGKIPNRFEDHSPLCFEHAIPGALQLMDGFFSQFLITLLRNEHQQSEPIRQSTESRQIVENTLSDAICDYLQNNLNKKVTLQELCDRFKIGKSYLCKLFRESHNCGIMEYFMKLKIREAKKLIRSEEYNITQISDLLGFSCIHHFSRTFHKVTGFSPSAYRRSIL